MKVKVKICGIRTKEAAIAAFDAGADFLGFNFVAGSKRFISPSMTGKIISGIEGKAKIVGVFRNADVAYINDLVGLLDLDFVQLHGDEDMVFIEKINTKVIKAISLPKNVGTDEIIEDMQRYQVGYFLIDRERQGEGDMVDREKAQFIAKRFSVFLAGGLNPHNIAGMTNTVKPYAVDVASGIEIDGSQDIAKIKEFIKNAKGVVI